MNVTGENKQDFCVLNSLRWALGLAMAGLLAVTATPAHSPNMDADLTDWCFGASSNTVGGRTEDTAVTLECGNCSVATNLACEINSDCPAGETCVDLTSKVETAFWDNRTDGAVNDLGTVSVTQDAENLYIAAELWVDPDPESLPFGLMPIDFQQGGVNQLHDPQNNLVAPGVCSGFTDRACTSDVDCHFCAVSTEPFPSTRLRACGSGCNPDIPEDVCMMDQTCENLGEGPLRQLAGAAGGPAGAADHLLVFDFGFWLTGADDGNAVLLMEPGTVLDPTSPWDPVFGCEPDFVGDNTQCDFPVFVDPGASGGSGGPPGSVELAIPWSAFGCTDCPPVGPGCVCPGFGPGQDFRYTLVVARGIVNLDYRPDGAVEDVLSEPVAATTTTPSSLNCPSFGIGATACEISDESFDAFLPLNPPLAHETVAGGSVKSLYATKNANASVTLDWARSCSSADNDYEVYEGDIDNLLSSGTYNHVQLPGLCTTGGATTATFNPGVNNHYYLIVPSNGATEGSYGSDSAGVARPTSTGPCAAQSLGTCP